MHASSFSGHGSWRKSVRGREDKVIFWRRAIRVCCRLTTTNMRPGREVGSGATIRPPPHDHMMESTNKDRPMILTWQLTICHDSPFIPGAHHSSILSSHHLEKGEKGGQPTHHRSQHHPKLTRPTYDKHKQGCFEMSMTTLWLNPSDEVDLGRQTP